MCIGYPVDVPQGIEPTVRFSEPVDPATVEGAIQLLSDGQPVTVRLLDARGEVALESGHPLVRAWPDSMRTLYQWSWWEIARPDTLRLVFTSGFAGAQLALRPAGDGFTGTMSTFSDVDPAPVAGAIARLRPVACTSPLRSMARPV